MTLLSSFPNCDGISRSIPRNAMVPPQRFAISPTCMAMLSAPPTERQCHTFFNSSGNTSWNTGTPCEACIQQVSQTVSNTKHFISLRSYYGHERSLWILNRQLKPTHSEEFFNAHNVRLLAILFFLYNFHLHIIEFQPSATSAQHLSVQR